MRLTFEGEYVADLVTQAARFIASFKEASVTTLVETPTQDAAADALRGLEQAIALTDALPAGPTPDEPQAAPKRTRRSSKQEAPDTSTEKAPKRSRRSKASPSPQTEDGGASTDETKPRARRRKTAEAPEGVTDADLNKAAAMIAENYGADEVHAVLGEFKVDDVQGLSGDDRQEFIDMAMAPAGDAS